MNIEALLLAIAMVESGCDDSKVGAAGERGRYQIGSSVWNSYTREPHQMAHEPIYARYVAVLHINWIEARLPKRMRDANEHTRVWWVAASWNGGLSRCSRSGGDIRKLPRSVVSYADRVVNLYVEQVSRTKVNKPAFSASNRKR